MPALINKTNQINTPIDIKICKSFLSRFTGLMFLKEIPTDKAIAIVEPIEGITSTSIHMFFMRFDIAAIWLNSDLVVVHKTIAKKWKPYYSSPTIAKIIIETHISRIDDFNIGDQIVFENV